MPWLKSKRCFLSMRMIKHLVKSWANQPVYGLRLMQVSQTGNETGSFIECFRPEQSSYKWRVSLLGSLYRFSTLLGLPLMLSHPKVLPSWSPTAKQQIKRMPTSKAIHSMTDDNTSVDPSENTVSFCICWYCSQRSNLRCLKLEDYNENSMRLPQ